MPPSYSVATSLPTYEEAERTKEEEAQRAAERPAQPTVSAEKSKSNGKSGQNLVSKRPRTI